MIVVSPDRHLGGLSAGGLGYTDTGNKSVIGGLARDFYHRVWQHYQRPETWRWQTREEYGNKGQGTPAIDGENRTQWIFEPHVAEKVFEDLVKDHQIPVHRDEWLDRSSEGVELDNGRIVAFRTLSGKRYSGRMFLDATYEGDLMAAARVSYHVGREANSRTARRTERRPERTCATATSSPKTRRPLRRTGRSVQRTPAAGPWRRSGRSGPGRRPHPGLLLPHVPDPGGREPRTLRETRRLRSV